MLKTMMDKKIAVTLPQFVSIAGAVDKNMHEMAQFVSGEWAGGYTFNSILLARASTLPKKLDQIDIGPMVMMDGAKTSGAFSRPSFIYSISKNSKHPEAAAKFLNYLLATPEAARIVGMTRGAPATKIQFDTLVKEGLIHPTLSKAMDRIDEIYAGNPVPPASAWFEHARVIDPIKRAVEQVSYGTSPEQAADRVIAEVGEALRRM